MGAAAIQCCKDEAEHFTHICFLSEEHQPSVPWDTLKAKGVHSVVLDEGSAIETQSLSEHSAAQLYQQQPAETFVDEEDEETEEERARRDHEEYMASPLGVFVRQMTMGVAVTLVTHPKGDKQSLERTPAVCKIDDDLTTLSLSCKGAKLACQVSKIVEVLQVERDGKDVFPSTVISLLTAEELDRLVMVHYTLADNSRKAFIFLEPSVESRRRFRDFLKVLHVHARQAVEDAQPEQHQKGQHHEATHQEATRQERAPVGRRHAEQ